MACTLPGARQALVAAICRDTPRTESQRLIGVLDALINWSAARPNDLVFRADGASDHLSFLRAGSRVVLWSARVTRGRGGRLEICPPTGRCLDAADRATVLQTLNAHARERLVDGDRLRIGFAALKNSEARAAVLAMMEQLLRVGSPAREAVSPTARE